MMKIIYATVYMILVIFITIMISSCNINDSDGDDRNKSPEPTWETIPEFTDLNISYTLNHKGTLYVSAFNDNKYVIYETKDGNTWKLMKQFPNVGPITISGDTLYALGDSLYRYIINQDKWETLFKTPAIMAWPTIMTDMILYENSFYFLETIFNYVTYKLTLDGKAEMLVIDGLYLGGSKFLKHNKNGKDIVYARAAYNRMNFYTFDGIRYNLLNDGLTETEIRNSPINSMTIHNDTLFAGFRNPSSIKYLNNENQWVQYTDSMIDNKNAFAWLPPHRTIPTAILFVKNKLYTATNYNGIIVWESTKGWKEFSKGLIPLPGREGLFTTIHKLDTIGDYLIAGYTDIGFAYNGSQGLYKIKITE